ncbi:hypothetical protein GOV14_00750 [Candidatus Pacearchaeota archaeon]|nr:hypothetical protein [Candidatus Pacearchaeota archaeon]
MEKFKMKVKELIKKLESMDQEATVYIIKDNNDGCDTCGYGSSTSEEDIYQVTDIESKVWIESY